DRRCDRIDGTLDGIGSGPDAFAARGDDAPAIGCRGDERRVPAGRDEAERPARAAWFHGNDRDGVVCGGGDVQPPLRGPPRGGRAGGGRWVVCAGALWAPPPC